MTRRNRKGKQPQPPRWQTTFVSLGWFASILTALYFLIYAFAQFRMDPTLSLRLPGQTGRRIPPIVGESGVYLFAISTLQVRGVDLQSIEVHFDPTKISITPIDTDDVFNESISNSRNLPFMLSWTGHKAVSPGKQELYGFKYELPDTQQSLSFLITTKAQIEAWDWDFPLNLFSSRPIVKSFPIELTFLGENDLQPDNLRDLTSIFLVGQEGLNFNGSTTRYASQLWLRASRDSIPFEVRVLGD